MVLAAKLDAVANIQSTALLVSAFALGRGDLLAAAMQDRIHQPYRMEACPLLGQLLPLSGTPGILGVALSGAGPSVLLIADGSVDVYFGPAAPAGKESNWVPTKPGGMFEVMFRAYAPTKDFFDKAWRLSDIEKVAVQ